MIRKSLINCLMAQPWRFTHPHDPNEKSEIDDEHNASWHLNDPVEVRLAHPWALELHLLWVLVGEGLEHHPKADEDARKAWKFKSVKFRWAWAATSFEASGRQRESFLIAPKRNFRNHPSKTHAKYNQMRNLIKNFALRKERLSWNLILWHFRFSWKMFASRLAQNFSLCYVRIDSTHELSHF